MESSLRIGRVRGIEISAHWSVAIIFVLAGLVVGGGILPDAVADRSTLAYSIAGLVGAAGIVLSILLHELSHAVVAQRHGVTVNRITLWMLGGVGELGTHAKTAASELKIALAGPATSLVLAATCLSVATIGSGLDAADLAVVLIAWLGLVNGGLAIFNMLPGAPLDGGRVLTAALWLRSGDEQRSRWRAARVGIGLGQALMLLGGLLFVVLGGIDGLWIALVGWFVVTSARREESAAEMAGALGPIRVGELTTFEPETGSPTQTVEEFASETLAHSRHAAFPLVTASGVPVGVVTLRDIRRLPRERWPMLTLADIATPPDEMTTARSTERLIDVLERSNARDGRIIVVADSGTLLGIVSPSDVTAVFNQRSVVGGPGWLARADPPRDWT